MIGKENFIPNLIIWFDYMNSHCFEYSSVHFFPWLFKIVLSAYHLWTKWVMHLAVDQGSDVSCSLYERQVSDAKLGNGYAGQ